MSVPDREIVVYEKGQEVYRGADRRYFDSDYKDHDLIRRIDQNLEFLVSSFTEHVKDDKERFKEINIRIGLMEKGFYALIGIIAFIELWAKIHK